MWRDTNTSLTLTDRGKLIAISMTFLILSALTSGFAWLVFFSLIFDEMHIISTDYQLQPGLTLQQVSVDVFVAFNIWAFLCALFVLSFVAFSLIILSANGKVVDGTKRITFRLAFACWLVLCIGPLIAAVQYLLEMRGKLN